MKYRKLALKISKKMRHRGPDANGIVVVDHGVFAHERLTIIDIEGGEQPIVTPQKQSILCANGEIYNHKALRKCEDFKDRLYCSTSDCEVISGVMETAFATESFSEAINRLDGQFCFVWSDQGGRVIVARDPIGICSLYIAKSKRNSNHIWVVSEMKGFQEIEDDLEIQTFPPGHYFDSKTNKFVRYYNPVWMTNDTIPTCKPTLAKIRNVFTNAVKKRLMKDPEVQLGVMLSGGLDSSLVSSITMRLLKEQYGKDVVLNSFSIGLEGSEDLKNARVVAKFLGTKHHEIMYTAERGIDHVDETIYHIESFDITTVRSSTPNLMLARAIRARGIKIILSGEGSDELLAGYSYFRFCPNATEMFEETRRKLLDLHLYDNLRAHKSCMAYSLECRVPFLDKDFIDLVMTMDPTMKLNKTHPDGARIEKYILRKAFDDKENPYLPESVLMRPKDQFSDAVSGRVNWIETLKNEAAKRKYTEVEINKPFTQEHAYYRSIFDTHFKKHNDQCVKTVAHQKSTACSTPIALTWSKMLSELCDPTGRF